MAQRVIHVGIGTFGKRWCREFLKTNVDDGTIEVVARYTIRTSDGSLIYVQNDGLRVASPEILARMSKGEPVPFDSYRFRTAPRFETSDPPLKWLETSTFVGVATRTPDRVVIGFHEVL